jgi:hypothetical protein
MDRYDPLQAPEPAEWLDLDEQERIQLVRQYHKRARVKLPNVTVHALMHVIVENQCAMGDEIPVLRTLERLQAEGLDRHDAIHAVGWVLGNHMHDLLQQREVSADTNAPYYAALEELSAEAWRNSC